MDDFAQALQLCSMLAILFPIIVCILTINKGSLVIRLFLLFLVIGLSADLIMYILIEIDRRDLINVFYNFYSLSEAVFFIYLIKTNVKNSRLKKISNLLFFFTSLFWLSLQLVRFMYPIKGFYPSLIFDLYYEISFSFLAGFVLLEMVEKEDSVSDQPMFWIFLGIFFYCFCTFFIATFLNTELSQKLWFLHNIFNIITLGFYTVGLWKYYLFQKKNAILTLKQKK